jgi:hypothetical protein
VKLASHLRRSRHGIYYFRLKLPPAVAVGLGQLELQHSLATRCPTEARQLGYHLWASFSPRLKQLETLMASNPLNLDPKAVKKLIVEGLTVRPDGGYSVSKLITSDDPILAQREMEQFRQMVAPRLVSPTSPRI